MRRERCFFHIRPLIAPSAMAAVLALTGCGGAVRSLPLSAAAQNAIGQSEVQPLSDYKSIFSFDGADGTDPIGGLISLKNTLYGTATDYFGQYCCGVVYKITTGGAEKTLYTFKGGSDGTEPWARLTDVDGTLYSITFGGGAHSGGTVFRITTDGKEKVLHAFGHGSDGAGPIGPLTNVGGVLYGTTGGGGSAKKGTVFRITTSGAEKVIYSFKGYPKDGEGPQAGLTDVKGSFYGTTCCGGSANDGTVFKVTTTGSEKVLHVFTGKDGCAPSSTLLNAGGTLYGETSSCGGSNRGGTIFKISSSGSGFKVLHTFKGKPDAAGPGYTGLTAFNGALYGVTSGGGSSDNGAVFRITTTGKETVLYSFKGGSSDGRQPQGVLLNVKGVMFGSTSQGGSSDDGTVYWIKP
jgi:uncharacterized repeat protein (TIGR03803 family)